MFLIVQKVPPMSRGVPNPSSTKEVAKRLLSLRIALGRTQEEMGKLAGVGGNAWQNYEKGRQVPRRKNADMLFERAGIPPEWVYHAIITRLPIETARKIELAIHDLAKQPERDRRRYRQSRPPVKPKA
jgi:transcriptional regulator with XRE-family HTH domain